MAQNWAYGGAAVYGDPSRLYPATALVHAHRPAKDGDLLVALVTNDSGITVTPPSGFAHVTGSPVNVGGTARYNMLWKIASAEGNTYTFTVPGSGHIYVVVVLRYENISASPGVVSAVASASSTTVTGPTVTTTATDALIVRSAHTFNATALAFASGTSRGLFGGDGDLIRVVDSNQASIGATGTNVATATGSSPMASFTAAFNQGASPTTHVVSGSGSISIGPCAGLSVSYTGIPTSLGTGKGNPVRYFELGNIAWATANGATRNYYLEHNPELIPAPFVGASTIYYSLIGGVTATFSELLVL